MKQTMREIENRIRKQIGEESKFVVIQKSKDDRIVEVSIGEWVANSVVKELEEQADITKREQAKIAKEAKEKEVATYLSKFAKLEKQLERQSVINAFLLFELDLVKGVCEYPDDYDKMVVWFSEYLTDSSLPIYESDLLLHYIKRSKGE